jgi:hypothetical protein
MLQFVVDFQWQAVGYISETIENTTARRNLSEGK